MTEHQRTLTEWGELLTIALQLQGLRIDSEAVLSVAGTVAHAVLRPAAPLTTFVLGYAAGLKADLPAISQEAELKRAIAVVEKLCETYVANRRAE